MRTVVIGIGNPLRSDDGVGLRVARELRAQLAGGAGIEVVELCAGGLRLVEAMAGYDRAIVIDAVESGGEPGSIRRLDGAMLPETRNATSTHDGNLPAAFALGRAAGLRLPAEVLVWGVEAGDVATFGERFTPAVEAAVARVVEDVRRELAIS